MKQERRVYDSWHFDKRIPLALIGTLVLQLIVLVWGASKLDSRVLVLEKATAVLQDSTIESVRQREDIRLRLTRIEDRISYPR